MPKTPITAKFIRVPVEGGRLPVAPAFNDFLDAKHMVVVELGMHKGNLLPEYFDAEKSAKMVEEINAFNAACRKAGIPIVHAGYKFRKGGLDLVNAQYPRITPLSGKKPFPNPAMEEDTDLWQFATEVAEGDHKLLSAKRHSAFEGTDLEFLLKILGCKTIVFVGAGLDCIGMGTGFYGMIKDFKCLVVEDRFYPYFEDLGEECAKACTMFIGLVVRADELTAEIQAQGKE